jgi:hypothetical protein
MTMRRPRTGLLLSIVLVLILLVATPLGLSRAATLTHSSTSIASGGTVAATAARALPAVPSAEAQPTAVTSAQAIAWLNAQRVANGIPGGITDNPAWDQACAAHNNWVMLNPNAANPHIETPGTPGYTTDGAFAGATAVLGGEDWSASSQYPWGVEDPWEMAPIHLMQLLGPALSVTGYAPGPPGCMITWAGYQRPAPPTPQLLTYPGNGTNFIYPSEVAGEWPFTPNDFVGLAENATTGPYLYVLGYGTGPGTLSAASLTGPVGPVPVATVDDATTGALGDLGAYLPPGGIIIPTTPLQPGATYTASVTFTPYAPNTCDDGSFPGDGGFAANGAPLCADGSPLIPVSPIPANALSLTWSFTTAFLDPQLAGTFSQYSLSASTHSPMPINVTVTSLPSGSVVTPQFVLASGSTHTLNLPGGHYQACFQQTQGDDYSAANVCQQSAWTSAPPTINVNAGANGLSVQWSGFSFAGRIATVVTTSQEHVVAHKVLANGTLRFLHRLRPGTYSACASTVAPGWWPPTRKCIRFTVTVSTNSLLHATVNAQSLTLTAAGALRGRGATLQFEYAQPPCAPNKPYNGACGMTVTLGPLHVNLSARLTVAAPLGWGQRLRATAMVTGPAFSAGGLHYAALAVATPVRRGCPVTAVPTPLSRVCAGD